LNSKYSNNLLYLGGGDWVPSMKKAFNDEFEAQINLGGVRKPL
jgi:hypothetical protein